jgi:hypothetical protein
MFKNTAVEDIFSPKITEVLGGNSLGGFANSKLIKLFLPLLITVGDYAFQGCQALTQINFPLANNVGKCAF